MAATVTSILTQAKALALSTLGVGFKELRFAYDVKRNDIRDAEKAYSVVPLEAGSSDTVTHFYTLDQKFQLILTDAVIRNVDDSQVFTSLQTMYSNADEIYKAYWNQKLNLPTTILLVTDPALGTPEIINQSLIVLRMNFVVKYRQALN